MPTMPLNLNYIDPSSQMSSPLETSRLMAEAPNLATQPYNFNSGQLLPKLQPLNTNRLGANPVLMQQQNSTGLLEDSARIGNASRFKRRGGSVVATPTESQRLKHNGSGGVTFANALTNLSSKASHLSAKKQSLPNRTGGRYEWKESSYAAR